MTEPTDDPYDDDADDLPAPTQRYALWADLGFGPALGGLVIAFLAVQPQFAAALSGYSGDAAYRVVANLIPIVAGAFAIGIGVMTLRTTGQQLARALAVASLIVGVMAVVSGAVNWYGVHATNDDIYGSSSSSPCPATTYDPNSGDPSYDSSLTITPDNC